MKRLKKKDLLLLANKLIEKKMKSSQYYRTISIIYKKEKHKISKTIKNNYLSTKSF